MTSIRHSGVYRMLGAAAAVTCALALFACGGRRAPIAHASAPDPAGCFIEVFAEEDFRGPREFLNGPAKYWHLKRLPFRQDWHERIRSLRVGPGATAQLWARQGFEGDALKFGPDRSHPRLLPEFSAKVASLQIACTGAPAE
jgi:hypothetical protein